MSLETQKLTVTLIFHHDPISKTFMSSTNGSFFIVFFCFCRLLDKQMVSCPNSDSCTEELQRGSLDDHLKYRCSGTLVACQYAGAGCDYRGPKKSMAKHQTDCKFQKEGKASSFGFNSARRTLTTSFKQNKFSVKWIHTRDCPEMTSSRLTK